MAASVVASTSAALRMVCGAHSRRQHQRVASSHNRAAHSSRAYARPRTSRWVAARATEDAEVAADEIAEEVEGGEEEPAEALVSSTLAEFAEAGYPSDEGDAKDPISRTKAMNGAVDDLYALINSEVEVLGQAFDLLEKLGVKGLERPPGVKATDPEPEENVEEEAEEEA